MTDKPTYEELERRVKELEQEAFGRHYAKEELQKSKAILKAIFDSLPFDVFALDPDNRYFLQNPICKKNWGDLIGKCPEDLPVNKETLYLWADNNRRAFAGETVADEVEYHSLEGKKYFYYNIIAPIRNEEKIFGILGVLVDISELKQTEEALMESEKRHRSVVESQAEMICRFLPDGTLTFLNEAYCRYFGKSCKELIGQNFVFLIPEDDRKKVLKNIVSLNQNNPVMTHEHQVINPNGEISWHRWTNRAIFDDQNELMEFQSVGWDITERDRAEKALRKSEKRYRRLVETMNDGIGIQDENGFITYVNNKFCQMLNYKLDELIGKPVTNFLDDHNSQILKNQTSIRRKGKVKAYEIEWTCKYGRKIQTIMSPQAIFNDNGQFKGSFSVITDISIFKQVEEELRKTHDELETRVAERTKELEIQKGNLEETNIALQVLLDKRKEDKKETEDNVLTNAKELIVPYIEKIRKTKLDDQQKALLSIIGYNINEIVSPFTRKMSLKYLNLTPTEIHVANLIRHGSDSKEIAELMGLSPRTIYNHRKNIRKKLGLDNKKTNLRSHLLSIY